METEVDSGGQSLVTQFKYDVMGHLTGAISPKNLTTTYSYNTLGRLTEKSTPDNGTTQYLYDKEGNLRFIKDADHAGSANASTLADSSTSGNHSSGFTLKMPGQVTLSATLYETLGGYPAGTLSVSRNGVVLSSITSSGSTVSGSIYLPKGTHSYNFTIGNGAGQFGYTIICGNNYDFVYRKYDALNRLIEEGEHDSSAVDANFSDFQQDADTQGFPSSNTLVWKKYGYDITSIDANASGQTNLLGRLSYTEYFRYGSRRNLLSYSYDDMGRVAWKVNEYSWYPKKIYYTYDLQGNVTQREYHDLDSRNNTPFYTNYTYDVAGRLDNVKTTASSTTQEASYSYFASGKRSQLKLGPSPLATVNYHYNQRGWLTSDSSTDFWEHVGYNLNQEIGGTAQYNGSISWMTYYMSSDSILTSDGYTHKFGYSYSYDHPNRLTEASFGVFVPDPVNKWQSQESYSLVSAGYNDDGNISSLERAGSGADIADYLNYTYQSGSHRLTQISNQANSTNYTYTYDSDGNIQSDSKDGIGFAVYDPDNQPVKVWMTNGTVLQYGYDVDGYRTEKIVNSTYTLYFRGKDERTQAINLEPYSTDVVYNVWAGADNIGQVKCSSGSYSYYYYLKDHLGDVRMILDHNGTPQVWNNYYPFGEEMPGLNTVNAGPDDRYQFTSKELDPTTSLYYFGARYYDAWSGRWLSVDPLAKKYPGWGPYNYVQDDPIRLTDPNGEKKQQYGEIQQQAGSSAGPASVTTEYSHVRVNVPFLKMKTYVDVTSGNKNSPRDVTINAVSGDVESTTYTSPNHLFKTTVGTNNTWFTLGFPFAKVGRSVQGRYILDLSAGGGNTRTGITIRIDGPHLLVHQAVAGFRNLLNSFAKHYHPTNASGPLPFDNPPLPAF